jgi:antitoxin MazE
LALRIPKPFAEDAGVRAGTTVDLSVSEGRLLAAPIRGRKPRLKDLLAKVNKKNLHVEISTGPPVGREIW